MKWSFIQPAANRWSLFAFILGLTITIAIAFYLDNKAPISLFGFTISLLLAGLVAVVITNKKYRLDLITHQAKAHTKASTNSNLLLNNVLSAASDVNIIATNTDGIITLFNSGAERMLGYQAEDVIGQSSPIIFYLPEEIRARAFELSQIYGHPVDGFCTFTLKPDLDGSEKREWTLLHKNGSQIPVSLTMTKMLDDNQQPIGYLGIATNMTAQQQFNTKLVTTKEQLLLAADVAKLGIWSWNLEDDSLEWNDKMFELYDQPLNLKHEGLYYRHWFERIYPDDAQETTRLLQNAIHTQSKYNPIFRIVLPNGKLRYIESNAYVEKNNKGTPVKVTGINRDVTSEKELEPQLLHTKEQADAISRAKTTFLANISHEIRTPMNAVLGMLQLLQKTELNSRQNEYIYKANIAAQSLLNLLSDILDYSKIEANKLELDPHSFDLEELLQELAIILSGNYGESNVDLMFDLDTSIPLYLVGDRMRLLQVLINLTSNALKFTLQGHVLVAIKKQHHTAHKIAIHIEVSDTGIGISDEQQKNVFEGFNQAETSTTRRFGGSGLGLAISKRLVTLMGGELYLSSKVNKGSCFWFDLTLDIAKRDALHAITPPKTNQPLNILIIDNNLVAQDILVRSLSALGWQAIVAHSEQEAFNEINRAIIEKTPFDMVILNWQAYELENLGLIDNLAKTQALSQFPVIVMTTAFEHEQLIKLTQEHAFIYFLTKPVTPKQLRQSITQALSIKKTPPINTSQFIQTQPRLNGIKILLIEDNVTNQQVVVELLSFEGALTTVADGGLDGINLVLYGTQSFDIVLMDVQMPDVDGLEATRQIRTNKHFAELPIIAMTANVSTTDKEICLSAGMNAHIGKPFDLDIMVNTILRFTERQADLFKVTNALTPRDIISLTAHNIERDNSLIESTTSILKRFGGNTALYKNLLQGFEHNSLQLFKTLLKHIKNQDQQQVLNCLHSLKGASGTIGACQFFDTIAKIENSCKFNTMDTQSNDIISLDFVDIDALRHLLAQEVAALRATINAKESESIGQQVAINEQTDTLKQQLDKLADLLKAGNLRAIDYTKNLIIIDPLDKQLVNQVTNLATLIYELKFEDALTLLEKIRYEL